MSWLSSLASIGLIITQALALRAYFKQSPQKLRDFLQNGTLIAGATICGVVGAAATIVLAGVGEIMFALSVGFGLATATLHSSMTATFVLSFFLVRPWEAAVDPEAFAGIPRSIAIASTLLWGVHIARAKSFTIMINPPMYLLFSFVAWIALTATIANGETGFSFVLTQFFPILVITLIVVHSINETTDFKLIKTGVTGSVLTLIALAAIATAIKGEGGRLEGVGIAGNSNDLAALCVLTLPLLLVPLMSKKHALFSWIGAGALSFTLLLATLLSQSRAAILAIAVGFLAYYAINARSLKRLIFLGFIVCLLPIIFIAAIDRDQSDLDASTGSRINYAIAGWNMVKTHPLFGVGVENYPKLYEQFSPSFFEWGERTAHSTWVLAMAETGFIGLLLLSALFFSILVRAWRMRESAPELFVCVASYGTAMSFLSHTYILFPYLVFSLVLGRSRLLKKAAASLAIGWLTLSLIEPNETFAAKNTATLRFSPGLDKPTPNYQPKTQKSLKLYGARGETVNFFMKFTGSECGQFSMSRFNEKKVDIRFFRTHWIRTNKPSTRKLPIGEYPDALIYDISGRVCPTKKKPAWVVGEFVIPRDAKPGTHKTTVTYRGKKHKVQLTIWKFHLPETPGLEFYAQLQPNGIFLGHFGRWVNGQMDLADQYYNLISEHLISPMQNEAGASRVLPRGKQSILDLDRSPTPRRSYRRAVIDNRPLWAYLDFSRPVPGVLFEERTQRYFEAVNRTLETELKQRKGMMFLWDEPQAEELADMQKFGRVLNKAAPRLKKMVTIPYNPKFDDIIDIWAPNMAQFEEPGWPKPSVYKKLQKRGEELWWYVSCLSHGCSEDQDLGIPDLVLDRKSVYVRSIGWLSQRYNIDGFLYFTLNYGYRHFPRRDVWTDQWDFDGNGDGTLLYPGRPDHFGVRKHSPVASIRLKLLRETINDATYLSLMKKQRSQPSWFSADWKRVAQAPRKWSRKYEDYSKLRIKIGNHLSKKWGARKK